MKAVQLHVKTLCVNFELC